jgi:hypothetical protein
MIKTHPEIAPGTAVRICAVHFDLHRPLIGKTGVVKCFVKSRGLYKVDLHDGSKWEAAPGNIKPSLLSGVKS